MTPSSLRSWITLAYLGSCSALMNTDKNLFTSDTNYVPNYTKRRKKVDNKRKLTPKQIKARNKSKAAKKARKRN